MDLTLSEMADARYRAMADPVRRRILRVLEDSPEPQPVEGLAATVSLHPNTVRGHLEVLERAGFVIRSLETRQSPGRPRLLYAPQPSGDEGTLGGYRLLAGMLAQTLQASVDDAAAAAEEAGNTWGRQLAEASDSGDAEDPLAALTKALEDSGFDPRPEEAAGKRRGIALTDCPFRDLARQYGAIVCSLHLGMMRGVAEAAGGRVEVESLEPFSQPSVCRALVTVP